MLPAPSPAMPPPKGSNANNLILCGPPRKKACSPSGSIDDCKKPSIVKALEAVVAAGRRGLLGPDAVAAVEAMPDVDISKEKACQREPNSVADGGENKKKRKRKNRKRWEKKIEEKPELIVNKECDTVEAVLLSEERKLWLAASSIRVAQPPAGIGNLKPKRSDIWICGNSVILKSKKKLTSSNSGLTLGFPPSTTSVYWNSKFTLIWDDLIPFLHQLYHKYPIPSIILIHVGENDLLIDSNCSLATRMQSDLIILRRAFPGVVVIWSALLPKHFSQKHFKNAHILESARNNVNCEMAKYCNETGIRYLSHDSISAEKEHLFMPDGTLSISGAELFIMDLVEVLKSYQVMLLSCF